MKQKDEMLQMALLGYQKQSADIDAKIKDIQNQLGVASLHRGSELYVDFPAKEFGSSEVKKRVVSAATRRKMKLAWARRKAEAAKTAKKSKK